MLCFAFRVFRDILRHARRRGLNAEMARNTAETRADMPTDIETFKRGIIGGLVWLLTTYF